MRTIYLGDTLRRNPDQKPTTRIHHKTVQMERAPRGNDMPVFDRWSSGGREDYEAPTYRDDDDVVLVRRGRGAYSRA
ncbi:hypothetical protein RHI9324_05504 [Rhizobium sp. CECT 9324]|nr:hypothetical protein RHI9324_04048 [Rhizobium sp. CECT 9324]CAH0343766.1 hypothetical protein RHI9324_05504 [Rhizobium sp. CECT 9324]